MANEYFSRKVTHQGNRCTWTWSGWLKPTLDGNGGAVFASDNGTNQVIIRFGRSGDAIQVGYWNGSSYSWDVRSTQLIRDPGSWYHLLVVVDTTQEVSSQRVEIYLNGSNVTDLSTSSYPTLSGKTLVNQGGLTHGIGAMAGGSNLDLWTGYMTDVFFVDGQNLTPENFGYFKEGNGYISVGSTMSTDFKQGQWVPKAPKTIRSIINARGGFGVNGFYLPMNDSSNFGADFHCNQSTIIKLKGENFDEYPQPKGGAPTTTDAYVDSLRDDPYKDYLVLAVPGISGGLGSGYGDYSASIKGSGTNKTITSTGGAGVGHTDSYYGSALKFGPNDTDTYLTVGNLGEYPDLDLSTNDFTIEFWRYRISTTNTESYIALYDQGDAANNQFWFGAISSAREGWYWYNGSSTYSILTSNNMIRARQWDHICAERYNGTMTLYINGKAAVVDTSINSARRLNAASSVKLVIGGNDDIGGTTYYPFDGHMQDVRIYNGVAKYKQGFEVPNNWRPNNDTSGATTGISTWRASTDTPANNFVTLNPISGNESSGQFTLTDGNLTATTTTSNCSVTSNVGMSTGKWYWEYSPTQIGTFHDIGISSMTNPPLGFDDGTLSASWRTSTGQIRQGNTDVQATGLSASVGDIVQVAFNASTRRMWVGVNGSYYNNGDPAAGTDSTYQTNLTADTYFFAASMHGSGTHSGIANFGQNPTFSGNVSAASTQRNADSNGKGEFRYEPPTDFLALCEDNLPTPAIADPGKHMKTVLYTGDGNSGRSITGVGFQPDLVWLKERTSTSSHQWHDSVRGAGRAIFSNATAVEGYSSTYLYSLDSDGFTLGTSGGVNASTDDYVAWCWKAGAGTTSANTDGSINSVVSVNQDAGFSIVSYNGTGANTDTGHGLSKTPDFIIWKAREDAYNWDIYHSSLGYQATLIFTTAATRNVLHAAPTETTIPVTHTYTGGSASGKPMIAYCWAEIEGFSKFGSYVGNGNADGPFVYCGFKPAFILYKETGQSGNPWSIFDSSRNSTNPANKRLQAQDSIIEGDFAALDFLSNGFKIRTDNTNTNRSDGSYIFAAFAESPFTTANAK